MNNAQFFVLSDRRILVLPMLFVLRWLFSSVYLGVDLPGKFHVVSWKSSPSILQWIRGCSASCSTYSLWIYEWNRTKDDELLETSLDSRNSVSEESTIVREERKNKRGWSSTLVVQSLTLAMGKESGLSLSRQKTSSLLSGHNVFNVCPKCIFSWTDDSTRSEQSAQFDLLNPKNDTIERVKEMRKN